MSPTDSTTRETVVTVTGEVAPSTLGVVLPHEHLLSDFAPPADTPESWGAVGHVRPTTATRLRAYQLPLTAGLLGEVAMGVANRDDQSLDDEALAVREAADLRDAGGGTLVDGTSIGLGRDPAALRRIAEATGLNIVMGAGWYHPARTEGLAGRDAASLAAEIVRDLTEGVDGVRAGVIGELAALDPGDPAQSVLLVAAARASAATGAPISVARSADPAVQERVLDLLAAEGADLTRVAVGDCDPLSPRPDDLEPLLARGVFVRFDGLGRLPSVLSVADDQDVAAAVVELARRGHSGRILLSQGVRAKSQLLAYGGAGYGFVLRQFVPYLRMVGADDALVETVTVANPRRFLTVPTPKADS
ncbi:phosphotriesterase [Spongiactinospora sp. TRM90649]|uniref:phosphotriesterase family protein n=1 Tax=Spongiactinospora sp. TRM90649 TaxID=3031114 RepID=UPI0023F97B26|nr:phosphotriesterase [Spongiactinospora sp. TRM90649]MDF5753104.1 phosphotriesterase [Spongiactinospora sp. TRM90649]